MYDDHIALTCGFKSLPAAITMGFSVVFPWLLRHQNSRDKDGCTPNVRVGPMVLIGRKSRDSWG